MDNLIGIVTPHPLHGHETGSQPHVSLQAAGFRGRAANLAGLDHRGAEIHPAATTVAGLGQKGGLRLFLNVADRQVFLNLADATRWQFPGNPVDAWLPLSQGQNLVVERDAKGHAPAEVAEQAVVLLRYPADVPGLVKDPTEVGYRVSNLTGRYQSPRAMREIDQWDLSAPPLQHSFQMYPVPYAKIMAGRFHDRK